MKKMMKVPASVKQEISNVVKSYTNNAIESKVTFYDDRIVVLLEGFGLFEQMSNIREGDWRIGFSYDFEEIAMNDCFKDFEITKDASHIIISAHKILAPLIEFTYYIQTVAEKEI